MANTLEKLAFEATQAARIGWYFGHKALVARLTKPAPAPHLRGRTVPDRQRLIADLWRLVERDWRNIEAGIYAPPEDGRGNPLDGLRRAADFFADLSAVEARRHGYRRRRAAAPTPRPSAIRATTGACSISRATAI